jgi:hypothetical protein
MLVANDWAAEVATTTGVSRVIPSMTPTCSSALRPNIAQITRPIRREMEKRGEVKRGEESGWIGSYECQDVAA